MALIPFTNTYARLPGHFYTRTNPTPVVTPHLIQLNEPLARELGIDPAFLATPEGTSILAGNRTAEGSEPLALAYAGHQFGHFVPQLGDGRANLLGEVVALDGKRYDIQLKGSGPTPFSRRGDGRAALGPVLREYLLSEAMHALGVPTTRALAAVTTGQPVFRDTMQPGAIFTRIAASHLRVGTFQFFAARQDTEALGILTQYALDRHYPGHHPKPAQALLRGVIERQAKLVAHWMSLGFIHGVMNTDNTSISGETIDYGPCAFLEAYDSQKVFSSIDQMGRYAYANQPNAMHWNLARLAETLLPLLAEEDGSDEAGLTAAHAALATFAPLYDEARLTRFRAKLGLLTAQPEDLVLIEDLLTLMEQNQADFTLTFRRLADEAESPTGHGTRLLFQNPHAFDTWDARWHARLQAEPTTAAARATSMLAANPTYIPRNHLVQEVIEAAVDHQDFAPFRTLLQVVTAPFSNSPDLSHYSTPALPHQCVEATFCGT